MAITRWRDVFDQVVGIAAGLVLLLWLAYGWERATGLTFATRNTRGKVSSPEHLAKTRRSAVTGTALCGPVILVYYTLLRPRK